MTRRSSDASALMLSAAGAGASQHQDHGEQEGAFHVLVLFWIDGAGRRVDLLSR
jgi:hypothetical protein